ncbi:tripartite tricarboxylate transporter substrate binding protein [Pigmentiphaga sp.]|uniref:Bug family tripartite tricarboxylate transporter substrate binding protein n=1 Tax=Pigmentiphaga sp. TaxID=1977564 RepID=UPI00128B256F|nr:tripartite tricarboxylate transporter substrate binding protein [Pigmentiphaga sp.]MPS28334.1 tripartite tricarboxylate transporter substrate binding protein [Alcaligenaceae bacterium SAGV5]MPS50501.1 tripartite tricarboxylate transporter substrate binding protein [Alcaligenaceae bacterium SAGV3]MPT58330.1 tripartite tricarboxylate transporter substrate binding protein [Alcaligenaceae bacterium]
MGARELLDRRHFVPALLLGLSGALAWPAAGAAETFPAKPVRWIVPFLAGGGADNIARTVAARAEKELGQSIVVENRPGAGGNVGAAFVARAPADGYTLLYGTSGTHAANPALYNDPGYDPVKDFAPVTKLTRVSMVLVVNAQSPIKSVSALIADLKANPGKRTFGSGGNGSALHIAGEMFRSAAGVDIVHVPYRGNAAATVDLLGGRLDMMFDVIANARAQIDAGRLRPLAVLSLDPEEAYPDVPTLASSGYPGFEIAAWDGVFAPANTPRPVIERLNAAFVAALKDPEVRKSLAARGVGATPGTPEELGRYVRAEMPRWAQVIRSAGIKAD